MYAQPQPQPQPHQPCYCHAGYRPRGVPVQGIAQEKLGQNRYDPIINGLVLCRVFESTTSINSNCVKKVLHGRSLDSPWRMSCSKCPDVEEIIGQTALDRIKDFEESHRHPQTYIERYIHNPYNHVTATEVFESTINKVLSVRSLTAPWLMSCSKCPGVEEIIEQTALGRIEAFEGSHRHPQTYTER